MTDPRRDTTAADEEPHLQQHGHDLDDDLHPDEGEHLLEEDDYADGDEHPDEDDLDDLDDDDGRRRGGHTDFGTFMDEEGEEQGERPAWATRRWSSAALLVAALAGAVVVAIATWSWPDTGVQGERIAEVELVGLSSTVDGAVATVSEVDGHRMLRIEAGELPDVADGFAQVWLLDQSLEKSIPVGVLGAEVTELWLPDTLNVRSYPMVEVSQEPFDGDPAHSGRTLWRGELVFEEPAQG
jgi:hypothetical protein